MIKLHRHYSYPHLPSSLSSNNWASYLRDIKPWVLTTVWVKMPRSALDVAAKVKTTSPHLKICTSFPLTFWFECSNHLVSSVNRMDRRRFLIEIICPYSRCWKITEKVSFSIASEASYVYILSGQRKILTSFWKPEACCQTALPERSVFIGQKSVENEKFEKFKCDILCDFQTLQKFMW